MRLTFFPELGKAVVTHFGHPVLEVLEWVSVPGTSTAHHLRPPPKKNRAELETTEHHGTVFYRCPSTEQRGRGCGAHLAAGVTVVSSQREAEVSGAVHAHHHMGDWHQHRRSLSQGHPQLLTGLWTQTGQDGRQKSVQTWS